MSFDVLQEKIREKKNPTVAGLDAASSMSPNISARRPLKSMAWA